MADEKKTDAKAEDRAGPPNARREALPALQDREAAMMQDADAPEGRPARPMSADERRAAEQEREFAEARRQREADNKRTAEFARMAEKPNRDAMKLFVVAPLDRNAPPFHFSNTPNVMLIAAETPEYARRMAVQEAAGDTVWADENQVYCEEYKPRSPRVISRDFRG